MCIRDRTRRTDLPKEGRIGDTIQFIRNAVVVGGQDWGNPIADLLQEIPISAAVDQAMSQGTTGRELTQIPPGVDPDPLCPQQCSPGPGAADGGPIFLPKSAHGPGHHVQRRTTGLHAAAAQSAAATVAGSAGGVSGGQPDQDRKRQPDNLDPHMLRRVLRSALAAGRANCRSLGFARDDKGEGEAFVHMDAVERTADPSASTG